MAFEKLLKLLETNNVFLSGGAGVGKSYLTNKIIQTYQKSGKSVVPLGSTGISAVNIGGYTIHSFFVFGIANNLEELKYFDKKNKKRLNDLKKILSNIDLIIIDEISMVSAALMDMIYYRLWSSGFSGKLLVVGDFYQLPPVIKTNKDNNLFSQEIFAFESMAWSKFDFKPIILDEVKRVNDLDFVKILSKIRVGICDREVKEYLNFLLNRDINFPAEPTYLFGRNDTALALNREKLALLDGDEMDYYWQVEKLEDFHQKRFESWANALPVDKVLNLKVGAPVIFTKNEWGRYVNGQRGVVVDVDVDKIVVRSKGKDIELKQHTFEMTEFDSDSLEPKVIATISQYPIKLAYAITIHKSQGMSIELLNCNLDHLFASGQLYVAISRSSNPKFLKIDYSRSDFNSYLERVIVKNEIVDKFYSELR